MRGHLESLALSMARGEHGPRLRDQATSVPASQRCFLHAAARGRRRWPSLSRNVLQPGQPARHSADAEAGAAVWSPAGGRAGFELRARTTRPRGRRGDRATTKSAGDARRRRELRHEGQVRDGRLRRARARRPARRLDELLRRPRRRSRRAHVDDDRGFFVREARRRS